VTQSDGVDPTTLLRYDSLIDTSAFIDNHILNMMPKNPDAFVLSAYFYKDRGGKVCAGPIWDFDLAMGGADPWGDRSREPAAWALNSGAGTLFDRTFYAALFTHAEFTSAYWNRLDALLAGPFKAAAFDKTIDGWAAQLAEAQVRDEARWPQNPAVDYAAEVSALKTWLAARITFLNANKGALP
jgi:hypothetical protein